MLTYSNTDNCYWGKSTDAKPLDVPNGEKLCEMDTSKFYVFDEEAKEWIEWEA